MRKSGFIFTLILFTQTVVATQLKPLPPSTNDLAIPVWSLKKTADKPNLSFDRGSKTLTIDSQTLLHNPELLKQAMLAVIRQRYLAGIEKVLPLYRQSPVANPVLVVYAEGLLLLGKKQAKQSIAKFAQILADYPQAQTALFYYAVANFENNYFYQAKILFNQLLQQNPPATIRYEIEQFLEDIRAQENWRFHFSTNFIYDRNLNNAPDKRYSGGFTFPEKISDTGIFYQIGGDKKIFANKGIYFQPSLDLYGKAYFQQKDYNDTKINLGFGFGLMNQNSDWLIQPFVLRRWYGNKRYSDTSGIRLGWYQQWGDRFSTYAGLGYESEDYLRSTFLNGHKQRVSLVENYRLDPNQMISVGQEFNRKYGTRDRDDSYQEWGLNVNWYKQWKNGVFSRFTINYLKTDYQGVTLLTANQKRKDKEWAITSTLRHKKVVFYGFQPALTLRYLQHNSNSVLHQFSKKEVLFNIERTF